MLSRQLLKCKSCISYHRISTGATDSGRGCCGVLLSRAFAQVKIWNTMFGQCIKTVSHHTSSAAACAWFPDGLHFLSAGLDR